MISLLGTPRLGKLRPASHQRFIAPLAMTQRKPVIAPKPARKRRA